MYESRNSEEDQAQVAAYSAQECNDEYVKYDGESYLFEASSEAMGEGATDHSLPPGNTTQASSSNGPSESIDLKRCAKGVNAQCNGKVWACLICLQFVKVAETNDELDDLRRVVFHGVESMHYHVTTSHK